MKVILLLLSAGLLCSARCEPVRIHVFVALADNAHQGILPVPAKIGNGDDAANNLYWGCSEALKPVFKAGGEWRLECSAPGPKADVIERVKFLHKTGKWQLVADAYRGSAIRQCTLDFFAALSADVPVGEFAMAVYIGHDGLMDFALPPEATAKRGPGREAVVLCCKSRDFFSAPLEKVGARPRMLTTQLMYPGAFILHDVLSGWTRGGSNAQLRQRAAQAYARNQKISVKAAAGVFAELP